MSLPTSYVELQRLRDRGVKLQCLFVSSSGEPCLQPASEIASESLTCAIPVCAKHMRCSAKQSIRNRAAKFVKRARERRLLTQGEELLRLYASEDERDRQDFFRGSWGEKRRSEIRVRHGCDCKLCSHGRVVAAKYPDSFRLIENLPADAAVDEWRPDDERKR